MPLKAEGEFALTSRNLEHAIGLAGQPVNFGTMAHDHEMYMMLADTAAEMRQADGLQKYAALLAEVAARDGHELYLAIAYRALGIAKRLGGHRGEAEKLIRQALDLFKRLKTPWQTARTLLDMAELEEGGSKKERAREHYLQALELFEAIQAVPYAVRARAALAALG